MSKLSQIPVNDLSRWNEESRVRILSSIDQVLRSGRFLNGTFTAMLREKLSTMLNGREVLLVGNGTDALTIALLACGVESGDHVATVSNAGGYATGAIYRVGGAPVLIDVDYFSAQMSITDLSVKLEKRQIKVVVVTHLYGLMADVEAICRVARMHGCLVIEDCAQSIGARIDTGLAGTFGDVSTFSFYPTKNLGAAGDAGAVSFADSERALTAKRVSQYGWSKQYLIEIPKGFNSRIDEIQAAVVLERLSELSVANQRRREIVSLYNKSLAGNRRMIEKDDESFIGHLAVLVTPERSADANILGQSGIQTSVHYPVLDHRQTAWSNRFHGVQLAISEKLVSEVLTLPCFPELSRTEIERICTALSSLGR